MYGLKLGVGAAYWRGIDRLDALRALGGLEWTGRDVDNLYRYSAF